MQKRIISTEKAPKAIGPYSQAVEVGNTLYISGQIAIDPKTAAVVSGGIEEQTEQVLKNMGAILEAAGYNYTNVVKTTCLLNNMDNFAAMNKVYSQFFTENQPARAAYQVSKLPLGVLVEIESIAVK